MAKFTYKGLSRHWHPVCTSELLFDNKDGSTKRLGCVQNTCLTAADEKLRSITTCRTNLLPAGFTDRIFTWGVEGGPWTLTVPYTNVIPATQEFVDPSRLEAITIGDPDAWIYERIGFTNLYRPNPLAARSEWKPQDPPRRGYQQLASQALNGFAIDPASIGARDFEPTVQSSGACGVVATHEERPTIRYFDVGATGDSKPEDHLVTFEYAGIALNNWSLPATGGLLSGPDLAKVIHSFPVNYANGQTQPYEVGVHPAVDTTQMAIDWTRNWNGITANASFGNAVVSHPTMDRQIGTPPEIVHGFLSTPTWHTGFRMQEHIQVKHYAQFGQDGASLRYVPFHRETRMYRHGYYATWEFVEAVPELYITTSVQVLPSVWNMTASARGSVTVRVRYHDLRDTVPAFHKEEYGPDRGGDSLPTLQALGKYNPPHQIWRWERTRTIMQNGQPSPPVPGDLACDHYMIPTLTAPHFDISHTANAPPISPLNVLSPRNLDGVAYYTYPLAWLTPASRAMQFKPAYKTPIDATYVRYDPGGLGGPSSLILSPFPVPARVSHTLPLSPDNFKIWRRKR